MTLAITGASGRLGRLIAHTVRRRSSLVPLRLITRRPDVLGPPIDARTRHVAGDFDDAAQLDRAFTGVTTLLLISTDAEPELRLDQHRRAIAAAVRSGVARIVYTSAIEARPDTPPSVARVHGETEVALMASGTVWTILRIAPYADALRGYIAATMGANRLILPSAHAAVAYVPRANAAEAAAGALLGCGHDHRVYAITGSHALTGTDIANLVGEVRGTTPTVVDADPWEYLQVAAIPFGTPRHLIDAMAAHWAAAKRGEYAAVSRDVDDLAGHSLLPLPDFIRRVTPAAVAR